MDPMDDNEDIFRYINEESDGKSKQIDGLVSEDLKDHILLSWFDAEDLGSLTITRFTSLGNPTKRIDKLKKKYESILKDSLSINLCKVPQ